MRKRRSALPSQFFETQPSTKTPQSEQALRLEAETLNTIALDLTAELDIQLLLQKVTDAGTKLSGAKFGAFFYNSTDEQGESYLLYTLSGAPREAFEKFGMPRNTQLFGPTFLGQGVVRIGDVLKDSRYGRNPPHHGMPQGHLPVRSYLAVPVISRNGEVLGGLFFGHPDPDVFSERAEYLILGIAAQASIAIDNARLYAKAKMEIAERKHMESQLRESEKRYALLIQGLPAAVYICDIEGRVQLYNEAAAALWGRSPEIGKDIWCGSYSIYKPDGSPLPLDECPMAITLREGRAVRGHEIVIERPDGSRRHILPYPEPIRDTHGQLTGAVNMLIDITERKQAEEAQALLAAIVSSSDDAIISRTLDGRITSWNNGAQRIFGYSSEEAIGQPSSMLMPSERRSEESDLLRRLRRGERIEHFETVRMAKDKCLLDISLTVSPLYDSSNRIIGTSKVARDITARKRAEQELHDSEERFRATFENAAVGIAHLSPSGCWLRVNDRLCAILGYDREELLSKTFTNITHPDDLPENRRHMTMLIDGEISTYLTEKRYIRKDGSPVWTHITVSSNGDLRTGNGYFISIIEDISERKAVEEALKIADRRKDEFLAMLGHELRNPLAPIVTALHLMKLHGEHTFERERNIIERQTNHLIRMVDDLLDVSRITTGKIKLKKQQVELADIVAHAIEMVSPLLEQREHNLVLNIATSGLEVNVDAERFAQAISNLLTNAAKYTEKRGRITVTAKRCRDRILLTIRDTGIGIDLKLLPHIFDLFSQGYQALDRSQGGLGLGLAIVRSLVTLHDGNVTADSAGPGQGSEFTIDLPIANASSQPAITTSKISPPALTTRIDSQCILIVDDNEDAAEIMKISLEASGHRAYVAYDGPSALKLAGTIKPNVAILDIGLPVMDGYELARRLHRQPDLAHLSLIAVTGYGQESDRMLSKAAGFHAHLVKPVDMDHLESIVQHSIDPAGSRDL